jgi:hypothetical protein
MAELCHLLIEKGKKSGSLKISSVKVESQNMMKKGFA